MKKITLILLLTIIVFACKKKKDDDSYFKARIGNDEFIANGYALFPYIIDDSVMSYNLIAYIGSSSNDVEEEILIGFDSYPEPGTYPICLECNVSGEYYNQSDWGVAYKGIILITDVSENKISGSFEFIANSSVNWVIDSAGYDKGEDFFVTEGLFYNVPYDPDFREKFEKQ